MKKNNWTLAIFLLAGLLAGAIAGELLSSVKGLSFLTTSAQITWEPKADLAILKYDLHIQVKLNLISLVGLALAVWAYRKL